MGVVRRMLEGTSGVALDPFAGVGRIHDLASETLRTIGVEIEPEWAAAHPDTMVGDSRSLPFDDDSMDAIVVSPAYGNRMADHHEARERCRACGGSGLAEGGDCDKCGGEGRRKYRRITYRHYLGRPLADGNSGKLQWGEAYRDLHRQVWAESVRVLRPGGIFILNVSDHVRNGEVMPVSQWHTQTLTDLGISWEQLSQVKTPRMRYGSNAHLRVDHEEVWKGTLG